MKKIRELNQAELEEIIKMDKMFLSYSWSRYQWENTISDESDMTYIEWIKSDTEIKSFALYHHLISEDALHLLKIITHPDFRSLGLASNILESSINWFDGVGGRKILLEVAVDNLSAIKVYRHCGFEVLRTIKGFYSDGNDALSMIRYIHE